MGEELFLAAGLLIWVLACGSSMDGVGCLDMSLDMSLDTNKGFCQKALLFRSIGKGRIAGNRPIYQRFSASYGQKGPGGHVPALDARFSSVHRAGFAGSLIKME